MSRITIFKLANYTDHRCLRCGIKGALVQFYGLKMESTNKKYPVYCSIHVPTKEAIQKALSK